MSVRVLSSRRGTNSLASIFAVDNFFEETGMTRLPLIASAIIIVNSGRSLPGQAIEAFLVSMKHARPFTVGANCAKCSTDETVLQISHRLELGLDADDSTQGG